MKKILFVNFSNDWGGGENWYDITSKELSDLGYIVEFFGNAGSELQKRVNFPFYTMTISSLSFLNPFKMIKIWKTIRKISPDVVILNSSKELKSIAFIASYLRVEKIIYRRGILNQITPSFLNKFLLKRCTTHYIANSKTTRLSFSRILDPEKVEVIYNGIKSIVKNPRVNYKSKKTIIAARLSEEKGVDLGIKAFAEVAKKDTDAELHIFGVGAEDRVLRRLVTNLDIKNKVFFCGFSSDLANELSEFSMLLMPSRKEGLAFVLLEAMNNNLPCVAFTGNSAEEIIVDGKTGYLVDAFNIELMAERILDVISNSERAEIFGRAGKNRLIEKFTLEKSMTKLVGLIER